MVKIIRRLRQAAHSAMLAELVAGAIRERVNAAAPAPAASILARVERWREIAAAIDAGADDIGDALLDESRTIEAAIADTPSRGDADLIAKAEMLIEIIEECHAGDPAGTVTRITRSLVADVIRVLGDAPPARAGGRP